jgi:Domain of unknown function (DUF303).
LAKSFGQLPLRLPSILSNHAVLQQSSTVKLWGWGPGSFNVKVVCSWANTDTASVTIGADCMWELPVKTPAAGGPYSITFFCGRQNITISDILIGEVWLCAGQSNMEFNFHWGISGVNDSDRAYTNKEIRFFQVAQSYDKYPVSDCKGEWKVCDSTTLQAFSSVGYFFGKGLQEKLKLPVGLIGSYWGGTGIQAWMPGDVFEKDTALQPFAQNIEPYGWAAKGASLLYNAMIHPIASYHIKGVIWYQGEANVATEAKTYSILFSSMIKSWRNVFKTTLPFYYVQIAPWNGYAGIQAALLREQQEKILKQQPLTGLVSIADAVTDVADIHPKNKKIVGERLAGLALKEQYSCNGILPYFPKVSSVSYKANIAYVHVSSIGRLSSFNKEIINFQIAGSDFIFYPASTTIQKDGTIRLMAKQVQQPVAVRYCFTNDARPGLFDVNALPLLPFRTDDL